MVGHEFMNACEVPDTSCDIDCKHIHWNRTDLSCLCGGRSYIQSMQ